MSKAAGLAGAMILNNMIALAATILFARLLPNSDGGGYGSLAALVSFFLILSVFGQALQVATAREGALGRLGTGAALWTTTRRWSASLLSFTLLLTVVSVIARQPVADAVGVPRDPWAAALGLPFAGLYLWLSTLAGILQGAGDYRGLSVELIGQQAVRLPIGGVLAAIGLGVFGAYVSSGVAFAAMCMYCVWRIHRQAIGGSRAEHGTPAVETPAIETAAAETAAAGTASALSERPTLLIHLRRAWAAIAGLIVIALLQNIDIIAAKHRFSTGTATSYGAVAVAAKVLIWVAMGAGFYLVPEVSRRRAEGRDPRPVLAQALGIVLVCAVPVLLIYAVAADPLIRAAFGADHASAAGSLIILGLGFGVLACTYLAVQYLLALHRTWFLLPLAVVAVAEPIALLQASRHPEGFAAVVLAVQCVGALVAYGFALRREARPAAVGAAISPDPASEPAMEIVGEPIA
jgi:O-antigen/teichoic acid export membrane protein